MGRNNLQGKKYFLLCCFSLCNLLLFAQAPSNYYNSAYGKKGYQLRVALNGIIDNHNSQSYSSLWDHFQTTDRRTNGYVWDMYSDNPSGSPAYQFSFSDKCGNYSSEGDCYNREHSVPASWFDDKTPMYTDLFHLYPTDGYVNNRRNNYPFGEVGSASWTSTNGSKLGSCTTSGFSGTVFEPIDEYKGDFARTYFYMTTRYMYNNLGYTSNSIFTGGNMDNWALQMFLRWHQQDPVSEKERVRNDRVYQIQGNRNPFIDYPELVGKIFSSDSLVVFNPTSIDDYQQTLLSSAYPNPATESVAITIPDEYCNYAEVLFFDLSGKAIFSCKLTQPKTIFSLTDFSKGCYIVKIVYKNSIENHKLIIY